MKAKKPMKATPANVSRILSDAGHPKRHSYPSQIRGWNNWSWGFKTEADGDAVLVRHLTDGYDSASDEVRLARIKPYVDTMSPHFDCVIEGFAVRVTAKSET